MTADTHTVVCHNCDYEWESESQMKRVTCPSCTNKTPNQATVEG